MFFNRHVIGTQYPISNITVSWETLGYDSKTKAAVRDLFAEQDLGDFAGNLTLPVDIHDARMVSIKPLEAAAEHESWRPWHSSEALVSSIRAANVGRVPHVGPRRKAVPVS